MPTTYDDDKKIKGISTLLPPVAADLLARASDQARRFPKDSVERVRRIDSAIARVKYMCPEYFRDTKKVAPPSLFE